MKDETNRFGPPIDLASEADFILGDLQVSPSTREVIRGGARETLEPRVMQVLAALAQAGGRVVSRDELISRCWEGRIVGEDAINRAIGRLRRLSEVDYKDSFIIETIARVGYRMGTRSGQLATALPPDPPRVPGAPSSQVARPGRRRTLVTLAAAIGAAAAGLGVWRLARHAPASATVSRVTVPAPVPPEAAALVTRGIEELGDPSPAAMTRAVALFQQAIDRAPRSADAWGGLAMAYALLSHEAPTSDNAMRLRALAAIERAEAIDPRNSHLWLAKSEFQPARAWMERERIVRQGLAFHPDDSDLLFALSSVLSNAGRMSEAADTIVRSVAKAKLRTSNMGWLHIYVLWGANRLPEADKAATEEITLFPRDYSVWNNRVFMLINTGRSVEALGAIADQDTRPPGIPDIDFDDLTTTATAFRTGLKADIEAAGLRLMEAAHRGAVYAERSMQYLSALGRIDEAFSVAEASYFDRGFTVSPFRYTKTMARYSRLEDRRTRPLFTPATKSMRSDPRFPKLVDELGLVRYWKETGSRPDYQLAKSN
jgi:DNA-binding winged helix-turn-helix (wHTH) protein